MGEQEAVNTSPLTAQLVRDAVTKFKIYNAIDAMVTYQLLQNYTIGAYAYGTRRIDPDIERFDKDIQRMVKEL